MSVCTALLLGCESSGIDLNEPIAAYRDRMLVQHQERAEQQDRAYARRVTRAQPVAWQEELGERESLLAQPASAEYPSPEEVLNEIPDPREAPAAFAARLERLREAQRMAQDERVVRNFERVAGKAVEYLQQLDRPDEIELSLAECIQRALENSYAIRFEAHNPAISRTQIVEAEAAFDAQFYLDSSYANLDQATASAFVPGTSDTRSVEGGLRKLLPSGMVASVALSQQRSKNNLPEEFQEMNPTYNSSFVASLQQPLLRGFGLDVNRAQINIRKIEYEVSYETFIQQVRDALFEVEQAYWQLLQARRTTVIVAESLAQNWVTFQNMKDRLQHDATEVEVANAESRYQTQYVRYLESIKAVMDAEDRLKNLMNDPALLLSNNIELVPTEQPFLAPVALDHFAEVRTAIEQRSEVRQARQRIDLQRINTHVAKNAILPKLDLSFQYEVQGLGDTADNSFDNLTTNRFISYTVGVSFEYNFGERAARAAHRRAELQESQAIVALKQITDAIVQEVNNTIRQLRVRYEQVLPALTAVTASERNLRSLQARTQRIDPTFLQTELQTVEKLASDRTTLLQVLIEYNVGIVQLEKAKGTLLDYNNVAVTDETGR